MDAERRSNCGLSFPCPFHEYDENLKNKNNDDPFRHLGVVHYASHLSMEIVWSRRVFAIFVNTLHIDLWCR